MFILITFAVYHISLCPSNFKKCLFNMPWSCWYPLDCFSWLLNPFMISYLFLHFLIICDNLSSPAVIFSAYVHGLSYCFSPVQVDKMVHQTLSETQCDSCFETATSARTLNGVCIVSPAVVHCVDCAQNLCASCCSRLCKLQSTHDDVCMCC